MRTLLTTETANYGVQGWREAVSDNFMAHQCVALRPESFTCSMRAAKFADSLVAEVAVAESTVVRRPKDSDRTMTASFKVLWQIAGRSRISQGPNDGLLEPGMWSVYDADRPYTLESSERSRFMALLLPKHEGFGWSQAVGSLSGRALDGQGVPTIVMSSLAALMREGLPLDEDCAVTLQESSQALLERALMGQMRARGLSLDSRPDRRLAQICDYMREHIQDPTLTAETVAAAFDMSRRSLYNLFVSCSSTPRAHLQQIRHERAIALLAHPEWLTAPIAKVAACCGYAHPSHFARAFLNRQGVSPSQWRERRIVSPERTDPDFP